MHPAAAQRAAACPAPCGGIVRLAAAPREQRRGWAAAPSRRGEEPSAGAATEALQTLAAWGADGGQRWRAQIDGRWGRMTCPPPRTDSHVVYAVCVARCSQAVVCTIYPKVSSDILPKYPNDILGISNYISIPDIHIISE